MILAPFGLTVPIYERGQGGVPSSTIVANRQITNRLTSYRHTITNSCGFESLTVSLIVPVEEALDWLLDGLGRSTVVSSPDAETVWEGRFVQVDATFGQEKRAVALDTMANRVTTRYTTVLGTPGATASASDTASQALYGVKDLILSANQSDATEAAMWRDVELARRKNPRMTPTTEIALGQLGGVQLDLTFAGWYVALDDLVTSNTSTTKSSSTGQVTTLLAAYNAVNAFFGASSALDIIASGQNITEFIAPDTTYRAKIEALLTRGNGTDAYAWGVYENRVFQAKPKASASPTTIQYQRFLGDGQLYDAYGGVVQPWNARPDVMYQVSELLDVAPVSTAQDAAARFYVARVDFSIDANGWRLSLEPEDPQDLSAILIKKYDQS